MADRRPPRLRRALLGALVASVLFAAACNCKNGECTETSEARLLDRSCATSLKDGPACEIGKGAEQTTGLTADSMGVHLTDGTFTLHLVTLDNLTNGGVFDLEVLAAADDAGGGSLEADFTWGSCAQMCPTDPSTFSAPVGHEYAWVKVEIAQNAVSTITVLPYDATLRLKGKGIDIADVRVVSNFPVLACSVSGPIGARR